MNPAPPAETELTERQRQVLALCAVGMTYRQIGRELGLTESGAESAAFRACERLGASGITHAVHIAGHRGLIGWHPDCGTRSTYRKHLRNGETPCLPCKRANAGHHQDYLDSTAHAAIRGTGNQ